MRRRDAVKLALVGGAVAACAREAAAADDERRRANGFAAVHWRCHRFLRPSSPTAWFTARAVSAM